MKVKQEISTFIFMSAMLPKLAHLSLRALLGLTRFGSAARTSRSPDLKSDNLQYNTLVRCDEWLIDQASDVPSIIFFIIPCKILCKNHFYFLILEIKSFECPKSIRNYGRTKLGTSDAWSTSRLSHRPSKPVYHIVDCCI